MNEFEQLRAAQIRKSFATSEEILNDQIEKAGPKAVIGELRTFGGRQYIKTVDGWKFHGKGTGQKAQEHAQSVAPKPIQYTKTSFAEKANAYPNEVKEAFIKWADYAGKLESGWYDNKQGQNRQNTVLYNKFIAACEAKGVDYTQAGAILTHAHSDGELKVDPPVENTKLKAAVNKWFHADNPVIDKMLDAVQPQLQKMINWHKEDAAKENKVLTDRDIEFLELQYVAKMVESIGSRIKATDDVKDMRFYSSPKGFEIRATIIRDGEEHPFKTDAISAGGYNIQSFHYRYITDTALKPVFNTTFSKLEARIKFLKEEDRLRGNIRKNEEEIAKYKERIKAVEAKPEKSSMDLLNTKYNEKYIKENEKKRPKLQQKLDDHLNSKITWEDPKEGDTKVEREKNSFRSHHPGIYLYEFHDGNWKHVLTTYAQRVREHGFNPHSDADILKYREHKKEQKQ